MNKSLRGKQSSRKSDWIRNNRGALTRLAEQMGLNVSFVNEVFWESRSSRDGRVEAALAEMGAPDFTKEKT